MRSAIIVFSLLAVLSGAAQQGSNHFRPCSDVYFQFHIYSGVLSNFKNALSQERVDAHVNSEDELLHAVQKQWAIVEEDSETSTTARHQYLLCSPVSQATAINELLAAQLADGNYRVLMHSVNLDSSCHTVYGTLAEISAISKAGKRKIRYVFILLLCYQGILQFLLILYFMLACCTLCRHR